MSHLPALLGVFGLLSILAVGGGTAILPEMKHLTVTRLGWVTANQFVEIYSLGQIAPGPNMTMVAVIGRQVAGWAGCVVAVIAFFLPSSLLAFGINRLWRRLEPWRGCSPPSLPRRLPRTRVRPDRGDRPEHRSG